MEVGLWRSRRGDTHPHTEADVDLDYWPQGTHAVTEDPALVLCATGGGGGAQQAMFRRDLDPLLARSLEHWTAGARGAPGARPGDAIDALFAAIQNDFEQLRTPPWADEFQASAVAVVVEPGRCAILERVTDAVRFTQRYLAGTPLDAIDVVRIRPTAARYKPT